MVPAGKSRQDSRDAAHQSLRDELDLWCSNGAHSRGGEVDQLADALCKVSDVLDTCAKIAAHRFGPAAADDPAVVLPIATEVMALFRMRVEARAKPEITREVGEQAGRIM